MLEYPYMTLTKDDLQAIGELVSSLIEKQVRPMIKEEGTVLRTELNKGVAQVRNEMQEGFAKQNQSRERHFQDLKAVMEQTYVKREEFEERYNELQSEVDDLRKEVQQLKHQRATA